MGRAGECIVEDNDAPNLKLLCLTDVPLPFPITPYLSLQLPSIAYGSQTTNTKAARTHHQGNVHIPMHTLTSLPFQVFNNLTSVVAVYMLAFLN